MVNVVILCVQKKTTVNIDPVCVYVCVYVCPRIDVAYSHYLTVLFTTLVNGNSTTQIHDIKDVIAITISREIVFNGCLFSSEIYNTSSTIK